MVQSGDVSSDAGSVDSFKSSFNSIVGGISNWEGSSKDNFTKQSDEFASYFDKVKSQMETFSQACAKYEAYSSLKNELKKAEFNVKLAEGADIEADIIHWNKQVKNINDNLEGLKREINALIQSASGVSISATSGSYDVKVSLNNSSDNNSSKSSTTSNKGSDSSGTSSNTKTANTGSTKSNTSTATSGKKVNVGDLDMNNYPRGNSSEDGKERAVLVAKYLMQNGGFTAEQAAAMVGVYLDENNCDPGEVMEAEKNGEGAPGTGGNGYGAGIASWTFEESKRQSLTDAGIDPDTPIENLSLEQQCDVIIAESQNSSKQYYDALRRCDTLEDASATAVVITGGVGFSNNWDTHPTAEEAKALSDYYGNANDASFGASEYHWNLDQRRLDYAKEIYDRL